MLVLGLVLFCGDLSRRAFSGVALFPRAAPTGGILLMIGWLLVGISAVLRLRAVKSLFPAAPPAARRQAVYPDHRAGAVHVRSVHVDQLPDVHVQAEVLVQALPHMQRYDQQVVVIKYGGHAMGDRAAAEDFAEDVVLLEQSGIKPIVVHGGGPQIGKMLEKLGIKSEFKGGLARDGCRPPSRWSRWCSPAPSTSRSSAGSAPRAARPSACRGKDGNMVTARKVTRTAVDPDSNIEKVVDLGFVGEPEHVNRAVLDQVLQAELIPVLAPVAIGQDGQTYNVNADTFAGAIAGAMTAKRLLLLTDVPGVLDKNKNLIPEMTIEDCRRLIADGTITDGMIPKIETCIYALEQGVEAVVILDGKVPHAVLLELFTDHGAGTLIRRG